MQEVYSPINEEKKVLDFSTIMQKVYFLMAAGLAVTGITALITTNNLNLLLFSFQRIWFLAIAEIVLVLLLSTRVEKMGKAACSIAFFAYAIINGITLAPIFFVYTESSIATTFLITASMFVASAVYGKATKKDITSLGNYLVMGLWGIIIAGIVNILIRSNMVEFAISVVGVVLFIMLIAVDVKTIHQFSRDIERKGLGDSDDEKIAKVSIMGALTLYLDFINLFLKLLRFFGKRRD